MARSAVVSGASIAGLSCAFWLARIGWRVTVIERSPAFRDGGQNVDVRGVAREVLTRMGLFEEVRRHNTTETGTVLIDGDGREVAELPSDGTDGATAELEVLRGDLARILLDHLPTGVEIRYDVAIAEVHHDDGGVEIITEAGSGMRADLLVIAEGVRSRTRDRVFGDDVERHPLGIEMVFGTIPRVADDDDRWRWYTTTRGRQVHLRPDNHGTTRAMLAYTSDEELSDDPARAARDLAARYEGAGWQTDRVLTGLAGSDDVYADYLTQIRMPTWHRGRTVLVGDAAWCVTPIGGGGSSLALTGAYVLAAFLSHNGGDTGAALTAYEKWMRPLVDEIQDLPSAAQRFAYPQTSVGLQLRDLAAKAFTSPVLAPLAAKLTGVADTDRELPALADDDPAPSKK